MCIRDRYCGQCHEPKEAYFNQEKVGVLGIKKHPRECECRRQKRKEEEQYREQQRHEAVVRKLKEHCFSDRSMKEWTFKNDKGLSENTVLAKLYVKDWATMKLSLIHISGIPAHISTQRRRLISRSLTDSWRSITKASV